MDMVSSSVVLSQPAGGIDQVGDAIDRHVGRRTGGGRLRIRRVMPLPDEHRRQPIAHNDVQFAAQAFGGLQRRLDAGRVLST